jgi:hypothetical protein
MSADILAALEDAYRFISQPIRLCTPMNGVPTALYSAANYNALTAKLRAAIAQANTPSAPSSGKRGGVSSPNQQER